MEQRQLLKVDSRFGDYEVATLMSHHHIGEREVYRAESCKTGDFVALTVYNLSCKRYESDCMERKRLPDFIEEVAFLRSRVESSTGFAKVIDSGITKAGKKKLGWIAQEFCNAARLSEILHIDNVISFSNALKIMKVLTGAVTEIMHYTRGGGHYNISTDNILVRYEGDVLKDVRLVGLANMGTPCSGNSPIDVKDLDKRFCAPENHKCIYSHRSDIYSLGMVLLLMLTGYPKVIQTEHYSIDIGCGTVDMSEVSSMDFYKALWKNADKNLSNALRLVLRKATGISPAGRFATIEKFNELLVKIEKREVKTKTGVENDEKELPSFLGRRPQSEWEVPEIRQAEIAEKQKSTFSQSTQIGALDEVAGMADLKALFRRDFIRIVRNPKVAQAYGIKPSNCTLLYGPQGCGKTFIAEKAAQESGLKYKIVNPSELGSIYVHGSQQKIAELFAEAEKNGPMILIFDEFDAIVPKRDSDLNGNQANEVNEMLTQLNNCASRGIYVLATTNRPSLLDPAIMRKGRIDRAVYVSLPDKEARAELFRLEIEKRPYVDMDYDRLANATENYTGSDISFIVEESARLCFEETLDRQLETPPPSFHDSTHGCYQKDTLIGLRGSAQRISGTQSKNGG